MFVCFVTVNFPFTGRDKIANTTETNQESIRGIYLKTSRLNLIKWRGFSSFMRYASFVFGLPIHRVSLCIVTSQSVTTHHELVRQWQAEHVLLHLSPCFGDGKFVQNHYIDVITSAMASQIIGISIVYSTVCSDKKYQRSASLAFVTDEFPAQRASNAENLSSWWRHHDYFCFRSRNLSLNCVIFICIISIFWHGHFIYSELFVLQVLSHSIQKRTRCNEDLVSPCLKRHSDDEPTCV